MSTAAGDTDLVLGGRGVLIEESVAQVNLLWGFLTVAFAGTLVLAYFGEMTRTTRIVVNAVFVALLLGSIWSWIWSRRHRAQIEIADDAIVFSHRGRRQGDVRFERDAGDLYIAVTTIGKAPHVYLRSTGSESPIPLQTFDRRYVEEACRASGWRFLEAEHGFPAQPPRGAS